MKKLAGVIGSLVASLILGLVEAPPASAGGCYGARGRAVYTTYSAPVVSYVAPAKVVHEQAYLKAIPVAVSPDYYSSVSSFYEQKLLVDAVAGRTAELIKDREQLAELRQELQLLRRQLLLPPQLQQLPPQGGELPPQQTQPPRQQQPAPPLPQRQTSRRPLPPVPQGLQQVVQQSCIRCHGATADTAGAGIDLRDLANVPLEVRLLANAAVTDGSMPKGGKPVSDEAALLFHEWSTGRKPQQAQK